MTYFTESSQSNSSLTGSQEVSCPAPLLETRASQEITLGSSRLYVGRSQNHKAPPLWQAPHAPVYPHLSFIYGPKLGTVLLMWSRNTSSSVGTSGRFQWKLRERRLSRLGSWGLLMCVHCHSICPVQHFPCLLFYCPSSGRRLLCRPQCPFPLSAPGELWLSQHNHCVPWQQFWIPPYPSFTACCCSRLPSTAHSKQISVVIYPRFLLTNRQNAQRREI